MVASPGFGSRLATTWGPPPPSPKPSRGARGGSLPPPLRIAPIDVSLAPPEPRARAIITHGHADHARSGHGAVLATPDTIAIMKTRYGEDCAGRFDPLPFGEKRDIDGVTVSLHPAGHILGSAQVLMEYGGQRIVVTGDYKRPPHPTAPGVALG